MRSKRLIPLFLFAIAMCVPAFSQTGMHQPSTSQAGAGAGGSVEQQIRALEEQARLAVSKNDPSFLNQYAADNYVAIGSDGSLMTKNQAVQAMKSGDIHYQSIDLIGTPTVRVFGDSAIVNGEASVQLTNFGQPVSGTFRYTRVWVKQDGGWKIASFESTPEQPQTK